MADLRNLAILTAEDINALEAKIDAKADATHVHTAESITSGTLDRARLPAATTSARGAVELATTAEALAGDTTRAVTGAGVKAVVAPFESRLSAVEAGQGGSSLGNVMVVEGTPTASAPVGFWAIDAETGDYWQME